MSQLVDQVRALLVAAQAAVRQSGDPLLVARADAAVARIDEPLRVAVAGRVKAGKSTLLNALVGQQLAPTDAGECTRVVTWYRHGAGYGVRAHLADGTVTDLPFVRDDGRLEIDLGGRPVESVDRIEVTWPSPRLADLTLIDTPGLASLTAAASARTEQALLTGEPGASEADAVIYLMRHLHRADAQFLEAFTDRSMPGASPVNAIAVLSRADEIGAARPDAMESAAVIARRYAAEHVGTLCAAVVPVAGLLAETAQTLAEHEAAALRVLAVTPAAARDRMLLSADTFLDVSASDLTVEIRSRLLRRFGLFGLRVAVAALVTDPGMNAGALARVLLERSGLDDLTALIRAHLLPRAETLKARSGLVAARAVARGLAETNAAGAREVLAEVERIEVGVHEFALLRTEHLVRSAMVQLDRDELGDLARFTPGPPGVALPAPLDRIAVLTRLEHWRGRGSDPLADAATREVSETLAHAYEAAFAGLA